ncbi:hypothetical protein HK097_009433 [Rhizophlyctis rosea]|uniref:F-box domain-containing protein n=1 Tax=Rhizophlyctis rosea TaxID=64517 RepID=A0AAD5SBQ4_9FUNG|nr:hypothetical protein HK097_009433 [Rhizophlyctis rosea]
MTEPTATTPLTILPPEILHKIFHNHIRLTLVQTHNTRDLLTIQLVNKMFASLVRPWKLQVAQAQVDYYGGLIEGYANLRSLDPTFRRIRLPMLISQTHLKSLVKNPLFDFPGRFFRSVWHIVSAEKEEFWDFLTRILTFERKSTKMELCNCVGWGTDDREINITVSSNFWVEMNYMDYKVLKYPKICVDEESVEAAPGSVWMYAVGLETEDELRIHAHDEKRWWDLDSYYDSD